MLVNTRSVLMGRCMHTGCSVDKCKFKLPAIAHACQASVCFQLEKGHSHSCIRLALNQPEQKVVGVVAATVEAASLQQKSVSQLSPTPKGNRSYLSSSFRLGRQLLADICRCKCQSYSRPVRLPKYPLTAWG